MKSTSQIARLGGALAAGLLACAMAASATPIETDQNTSTGFAVAFWDLINGIVPTVNDTNLIRAEEGMTSNNPAALTNGAFGAPGLSAANAGQVVALHNGLVLTYALDTVASPLGYTITNIDTYTGWRDPGRDAQGYKVYFSRVSAPSVFMPLTTVSYNPGGAPSPSDTAVHLSASTGTVLAGNVAAIRFSFPTTENGYVGYRELDVMGTTASGPPHNVTVFSDRFSGGSIDPANWQVIQYGLESPVHSGASILAGTEVADTTTNAGRLTLGGTSAGSYWSGMTVRSVPTFDATEKNTISVERVSLSGTGSAYRSSLWLWGDDSHYLHFSQNIGENGWSWNAEDAGGSGTASPTGSGNNLAAFDPQDANLGDVEMQLVWTPLDPGSGQIDVYLDGVLGVSHIVTNFPDTFHVMLSGMPRADGDTVSAVFDNVNVAREVSTDVPEPATLSLLALGSLALLRRRRRR